ncbi:MAG: 30S ribosomal protein S6 [Phycisphaerae bacterium]|nr:30S ribosomal protein S6 [Phycisphaerae bacterium]
MTEVRTNTYEGLFLFPQSANSDLQAAVDHVKDIINRAEGELLSLKKWDERRLAYEIKGNKRGIYFLTYFKARATQMPNIERDCNLSEQLLRAMVTRADHVKPEEIEAADAQAELSDEIKLRTEQLESGVEGSSSSISRSEAETKTPAAVTEEAPVEVATETKAEGADESTSTDQ